jgi:hypothetical protein
VVQGKWEACLNDYTSMACNVVKENSDHKKGARKPRSAFKMDKTNHSHPAYGESIKETAGIATVVALLEFSP